MTILDELRRDEARVLDRLVDGELGQAERRELLAALDDEPGSWRRCALAFLEAQVWRHELTRLAAEPLVAQVSDASVANSSIANSSADRRGRSAIGAWLALAASLAVAFGLGTRFPAEHRLENSGKTSSIAQAGDAATGGGLESDDSIDSQLKSPEADKRSLSLEYVTLRPADGDDASGEFQLAIVNDADGERWAAEQAAAASQLVEALSNAGLKVTRQQRLWPVDLSDGRRLIVPVEEFDIQDPGAAKL